MFEFETECRSCGGATNAGLDMCDTCLDERSQRYDDIGDTYDINNEYGDTAWS